MGNGWHYNIEKLSWCNDVKMLYKVERYDLIDAFPLAEADAELDFTSVEKT